MVWPSTIAPSVVKQLNVWLFFYLIMQEFQINYVIFGQIGLYSRVQTIF